MVAPIAILDACVLYPAQLRSLLMYLALERLFHPRWTELIHDEWMRSVLRNHPDLTLDRVMRTRRLMEAHLPDALVSGHESLIEDLVLPDPDDRHVLAAAIHADAEVIVTSNLADFPHRRLSPYGIVSIHPDRFICDLAARDPAGVCRAARDHRAGMRHPAKSPAAYLDILHAADLRNTVVFLRDHAGVL